jgi:hypothetical protein
MSNRIIIACIWWIMMFAAFVMAGCSQERNPAQGPAAFRAGNVDVLHDGLRIRRDAARNRIWLLGLDDVRVYDAESKRLIRKIALPSWSVARFICDPDMVLDSSGSAIVSSNVQARLWRIDADSFEVKQHGISLQGREQWDVGFGALAFAADGTLLALTSSGGSLWKIDVAKASASMIEPNNPPSRACAFTTQFLKDFERSQKP